MKVEDIMTRDVLAFSPEAHLDDAARDLTLRGFGGAPVRDADGRLLGLVSKSDLIDPKRRGSDTARSVTVGDVMTPMLFAVRSTDTVVEAARRMVDTGAHRLLVVDGNERLCGIVTTMDVLRVFVQSAVGSGES